jgi:hypothetical protein
MDLKVRRHYAQWIKKQANVEKKLKCVSMELPLRNETWLSLNMERKERWQNEFKTEAYIDVPLTCSSQGNDPYSLRPKPLLLDWTWEWNEPVKQKATENILVPRYRNCGVRFKKIRHQQLDMLSKCVLFPFSKHLPCCRIDEATIKKGNGKLTNRNARNGVDFHSIW